jgi:TolB-like protein/tetratricopeptide (TPR) repeat protein
VTGDATREELDRVLASEILASSPRLGRLLRYIVEKSSAGDRESLKEYSIGLDVFDRDPSFDPKADSIVRSTVRQLRLKLAEYYESEGRDSEVRIRLPKGSYVAQFEERAAAPVPAKVPKRALSAMRAATMAAIAATVGLAGTFALSRLHWPVRARSVVVLPFRDLSPDGQLGYIGEGLREELTSALVRTQGVEVMARASWPQVAGHASNPADAAKAARAETVVTGTIRPDGDKLQMVVSLVDGGSGKFLWSQTYEGNAGDLDVIGHSAVVGIAGALGAPSMPGGVAARSLPRNTEVLDLYLRASALARTRGEPQMREAVPMFERVIALQPDFALGYAAASANYLVAASNGVMSWSEAGPRGVELARTAVALDPMLPEAHSALGLGLEAQWQWQEAGAELSRSIELDPRYAVGYFRKAVHLAVMGRFQEAEQTAMRAHALDPSWDPPDGLRAELYYYTRRWDDALGFAKRTREAEPSNAEFCDNVSARVYIARGEGRLARPFLTIYPDAFNRAWVRAIDGDPQGGWQDLLALRRSSGESAFRLARFAAVELRDRGTTLDWLEQSLRDHEPDLVSLMLDPIFDSVRDDPRARAILNEIHLAKWPVWYAENR